MLGAYICGHKPKKDAYGHAACGVNHLELGSVLQDLTKT